MLQELLDEVKKKKSKHSGSTGRGKYKTYEGSDFDSSVHFHFSHEREGNEEQKDKVENHSKAYNHSKAKH